MTLVSYGSRAAGARQVGSMTAVSALLIRPRSDEHFGSVLPSYALPGNGWFGIYAQRRGQPYLDAEATAVEPGTAAQPSAMRNDHAFDKRQTHAYALRAMTITGAVETLEYLLVLLVGNAWTIVRNNQSRHSRASFALHTGF